MPVWLVRAGRHGQDEDLALQTGNAIVGYRELPDLSAIQTRDQLHDLFRKAFPEANPNRITNYVGQMWAFTKRIQPGDLIVLPLKRRPVIAAGSVTGPYQYRTDIPGGPRHTRPVKWTRTDLPRSAFDQDLLYSLGAFMTICQIERNNAEARIRALLEGKPVPKPPVMTMEASDEAAVPVDLERYGRDLIQDDIGRTFNDDDFESLVVEVLRAMGYQAEGPPKGADRGVDVLAGRGLMGLDPPRLCVQAKFRRSPVDVNVLRELQGVMKTFGAEQGLLVSWGGFTNSALAEARPLHFQVRLWDADDVIDALLATYDKLPESIRTAIPLKRVWTLVQEEE